MNYPRLKRLLTFLALLAVFISLAYLRFHNLSYSEFQDDEKKAFLRVLPNSTVFEFFITQRKGPMQFIVSYIPYLITHDFLNEFAQRFPFSFINTLSIIALYIFVLRFTKNIFKNAKGSKLTAFIASSLFGVNGLMVGFGRITQYQNLNLLFSFLSLIFYCDLIYSSKKLYVKSLLAGVFFAFSMLSHWDAIYYAVPMIYFLFRLIKRKDLPLKYRNKILAVNICTIFFLLTPFLFPYIYYQSNNASSKEYFERRVGLSNYNLSQHLYIFKLYNPFFVFNFYLVFMVVFILAFINNVLNKNTTTVKHYLVLFGWFLVNFGAIRLFMNKPGTHIYNYVIPATIIVSYGIVYLFDIFPKILKVPCVILIVLFLSFFYYQSLMLFTNHDNEYPWESIKIWKYKTIPYVNKEVLTFGFPHKRNWKEVNALVTADLDNCGYITNEGKEISQIYMTAKYGKGFYCYYVISIKRPFISLRDNVIFSEAMGKDPVYKYKKGDETLVKVYKIYNKVFKKQTKLMT